MSIDRKTADALYRNNFGAFAYATFSIVHPGEPLIPNWHIDCICYRLEQMARRLEAGSNAQPTSEEISNRLVINLPPRSMKSFLVSIAWVAWVLGRNPSLRIICASYSEELAYKFSRDCRALLESRFYKRIFRQTRINPRKSTESEFETTKRGYRLATSVGGTLTGRGADILIIDDPTKANDVSSHVALRAANEWFSGTALTRLNNPAQSLVLILQQRLHADDLSGVLIERGWPSIVIPTVAIDAEDYAIADDEIYSRPAGELLQSNRDSMQALESTKREIGSRNFAAQYLQNPTPPDGNMIKSSWLRRFQTTPRRDKFQSIVISCDPAGKPGISNDYTAIAVLGILEKDFYLLFLNRGHWTVLEMQRHIISLASQWDPTQVLVEDTSSGMGLIQLLRENTTLPVIGRRPKQDKETRLSRHQGRFEAGSILLPAEASWLADFESELFAFPNGRYDDQVDALLLFLDWFLESGQYLQPISFPTPFVVSRPRNFPG